MKIAIPTSGTTLEAAIDARFGRAERFLIFDSESSEFTLVDNTQNLNAPQGAGIQSAQSVASSEAKVLITSHCGPKAFKVLQAAGIRVYTTTADTISAAIKAYQSNQLQELTSADVDAHWA